MRASDRWFSLSAEIKKLWSFTLLRLEIFVVEQ